MLVLGKKIKLLRGKGILGQWEKRERGSNIIFPTIFRLMGKISSGKEGNIGEENQDVDKIGGGEEFYVEGNFIHS